MATTPQKPPPAQPSSGLTIHWRIVISVALLIHLTAVIAAPLAVQPASEVQANLAQTLRPYICASYLDHGYRFFAPMPSPGHLVRYKLEMPDGTSRRRRVSRSENRTAAIVLSPPFHADRETCTGIRS